MRFRFCGGLDCPDWVLAEITILSRMSSIKMKLLAVQVAKNILGEEFDDVKVKKFTTDAKYDVGDVKAAIAVLQLILSNTAKYDVDSDSLNDELQQLGLPKEHSKALCKVYTDYGRQLQDSFKLSSMKLAEIEDLSWKITHHLDPTGETVLPEPLVNLTLKLKSSTGPSKHTLILTHNKLKVLLYEMKQAQDLLQTVSTNL